MLIYLIPVMIFLYVITFLCSPFEMSSYTYNEFIGIPISLSIFFFVTASLLLPISFNSNCMRKGVLAILQLNYIRDTTHVSLVIDICVCSIALDSLMCSIYQTQKDTNSVVFYSVTHEDATVFFSIFIDYLQH